MTGAGRASRLRRGVVANLVALLVLLAGLGVYLAQIGDPVSVRNALALNPDAPAQVDWTPARVPVGFKGENLPPDPFFSKLAMQIAAETDGGEWGLALAISRHLLPRAGGGGAIRQDLRTTYEAIVDHGAGYCADYVDVFTAIANANGLFVRSWGFSFHGFGRGHIFVEVFDTPSAKWRMLDVFNNFYPRSRTTGEVMSAMEFREAVDGDGRDLELATAAPDRRKGFPSAAKALDYYRRGIGEWYLFWGHNVHSQDRHPLVTYARRISGELEVPAAMLAGAYPEIRVLEAGANRSSVDQLQRLRVVLFVSGWLAFALSVLLSIFLAGLHWERGRRAGAMAHTGNS